MLSLRSIRLCGAVPALKQSAKLALVSHQTRSFASPSEAVQEVEKSPATMVKVAAVDIDGVLRGKYVSKNKFLSASKKGLAFCSVVFGWDCAGAFFIVYHIYFAWLIVFGLQMSFTTIPRWWAGTWATLTSPLLLT